MAEFFVTSSHFTLLASYCILAASFSKRFILKLFAFAKYSNSFVTKLAHSKHLSKLVNSVKCGIIYSVFQRLFLLKYNTFSFHSQADVTCEKVHDGGSTCNYDNETILELYECNLIYKLKKSRINYIPTFFISWLSIQVFDEKPYFFNL